MPNLTGRESTASLPSTSPAEHARTMLATASGVELRSGSWTRQVMRHAIDLDGSILAPEADLTGGPRIARPGTPAPVLTLSALDVCVVPQPDRVRGGVILRGPVHRIPGALPEGVREYLTEHTRSDEVVRLYPTSVSVQWRCEGGFGWRALPVEDYTCADLDALVGWESEWISHLADHHDDALTHLARRADPDLPVEIGVLRPVLADRFGLVLRHYAGDAVRDVRIPFPHEVTCGCEAVEGLNRLLGTLGPEA